VFETGSNVWKNYDQWPPSSAKPAALYFGAGGKLAWNSGSPNVDSYLSDPRRPVPYTAEVGVGVNAAFMCGDQRFAWSRPDVLSYETTVLDKDVTFAGPINADLWVATTGTDSDLVVKVIDEYPSDAPANTNVVPPVKMAGYQMLVRAEIMRGKFRNSLEKPEPFVPNRITHVPFELRDVLHTFKKGHRIMVQVQSSWFPLADLNPQQFENIYFAKDSDFKPATERIYLGGSHASCIHVLVQ
jgi:putative CocE/NonD family hydrolase